MEKLIALHDDFTQALKRLTELADEQESDVKRDATIQRFEFVFELSWKMMQEVVRINGVEAYGPRNVIRESVRLGIIDNPTSWLDFLEDRNLTTHTYKESLAQQIYKRIPRFIPLAEKLNIYVQTYLTSKQS